MWVTGYGFLYQQCRMIQLKKCLHFGWGPYSILSAVNYRNQLTGGNQKQVVHKNHLKICLSDQKCLNFLNHSIQFLLGGIKTMVVS